MKISLGMPYWGQDLTRKRNFEFAWERMSKLWNWWDAEWRVPLEVTTRGGARNHLVRHLASLGADVVVLCDADTFVNQSTMLTAANAAFNYGGLHYPYNAYHYLTNDATETLIAGQYGYLEDLACDMKGPGSYGGAMAVRPDQWSEAGGSPSLNGWGF